MVKKPARYFRLRSPIIALSLLAAPALAQVRTVAPETLPTGFEVLKGDGTAKQSGATLDVHQKGQRAVFGWKTFDIGETATVNYHQERNAVALNLIGDSNASVIYGKLNADSLVFFVNAHGMLFARGASVNVGGLLATTMNMDADDFMKGNYRLGKPGDGVIRNEGRINASGSVALVANTVENAGDIFATTVTLAAGNTVAVDLTGDGLIRARVEDAGLKASIVNSGTIEATAAVTLTAGQARDTLARVVNNSGVIRATGLAQRGGDILLEGGYVANSGTLDASNATGRGGNIDVRGREVFLAATSVLDASGTAGGTINVFGDMKAGRVVVDGLIRAAAKGSAATDNGGFIETSAAEVRIADGFRLDARSKSGRAGTWLIDPIDFTITAGSGSLTTSGIGATTLSNALDGASVTIATDASTGGNGDIFVDADVSWNAATLLTLNAHRDINVNAAITAVDGSVKLRADMNGSDTNTGTVNFGGSGHVTTGGDGRTDIYYNPLGGYAGANKSDAGGNPYAGYVTGTYTAWMLVNNATNLQAISSNLGGKYALGRDIDASDTVNWNGGQGFAPVGTFIGTFDGLNHAIDGLYINRPGQNYVGLFSRIGDVNNNWSNYSTKGAVRNVRLTNVNVTGGFYVGALAGTATGTVIDKASSSGIVKGTANYVGGLVGQNLGSGTGYGGQITWSWSSANVSNADPNSAFASAIGGLAGLNKGYIGNSYATGTVRGGQNVGGLVGDNQSVITYSHATGDVSSNASPGSAFGGLVGSNYGGYITYSYATGAVTFAGSSGSGIGGLVGVYGSASAGYPVSTISNSYATGQVNGGAATSVGGLAGWNDDWNTAGSTISNTYATGAVSGADAVGGLIGTWSYGTISKSYATGKATATAGSAGGVAGANTNNRTFGGVFYDTTVYGNQPVSCAGSGTGTGCTGLATADMKKSSTYSNAGWNIANAAGSEAVWRIYEGQTYPLLRSFMTPLSVTADSVTKTYGSTDPALTYQIASGSLLAGHPLVLTRSAGEGVGSYAIDFVPDPAYDITYTGGSLAIVAGPATPATAASTTGARGTSAAVEQAAAAVASARVVGTTRDAGVAVTLVMEADRPPAPDSAQAAGAVVVAGSIVQRPAEGLAARSRSKGRALVCRGG